ncbi:trichohyalin-like isoform X4 [Pecten maximus]|uniref:trichohyalin-like isoform X4 n=1 Tax=Pecten maximus TaxID=6579 RepID=UPI0014588E38|nr:trichohyalin-like isoform X4 [Pecten maximus]
MSSLEERRAARAARRRRQDDNDDMKTSILSADLEERLTQRRRDREERLKLIAAGVSTINGEDEFERRRRERREQRLRGGEEEQEETTSRRSRRRQQAEEEEDSTSSYRSRRRRGGDDEDSYSAPAEPAYDEEAENRRRQQQEEEEAAARAAQEEYERQQEESRRQRQEEERQRREEEERRQRKKERIEEQEPQRYQKALQERKKLETRPASDTNGDTEDKGFKVNDRWSKNSFSTSIEVRRISEEGKAGKLKSFFETKDDTPLQMNGHTPQPVKRQSSIKSPPVEAIEDNPLNLVQEQLVKFETSMHLHHTPKVELKKHREIEIKIIAQGADRLKDIQKKFQGENTMVNGNSPRLGKFSSSEQHINEKTESWRDNPTVLNRWNHQQTERPKRTYRSTSSISLNTENNASEQVRRKSEKISLLTAKFNSVNSSKGEVTSPLSPREGSSLRRKWSLSSDTSSDTTDSVVTRWRARNSISKLTDRWQHDQADSPNSSFSRSRPLSSLSPEQNKENRLPTVRRSNSLNLDRSYTGRLEEEERLRLEREEQEREEAQAMIDEEARIEQEKLDAERIKREKLEQAERDREEEERQKLIETKLIMQKAAEDLKNEAKAKAEAKEKYINDLVPKFSTDGKDVAALQALCKDFHKRLASLEEDVYDWEAKIRKQDFEINELTLKVNDTKGKFVKPVLRKVNKTESKLDKIQRKEAKKSDFRDNLKSSSKHAVDEEGGEEGEAEEDVENE